MGVSAIRPARLLSMPIQDREELKVIMRKSDEGVWRVVAVSNLKGLLAQVKDRYLDGWATQ